MVYHFEMKHSVVLYIEVGASVVVVYTFEIGAVWWCTLIMFHECQCGGVH